ncbi:Regulator of RpoS [Paenibacillus auburnensis]|uniref:Regulator of RpoS n=1 Tax=Paenibacillus auburnensis TaxID=2905649 RepID=A0ABN8GMS7_9BACL|nr:response regulator [Paenibacillus auburnensis]CAH1211333.1 Regulator of RpoS [Paenibacillus auburnensis]
MFTMLIVEDERWEREGLVEFLDWPALGIGTVETAFDGIDGLEKALLLQPDIIVTDIQMPGMNGLDMAKQVRDKLPQVHIVILTGYDDFEYAREAIRFHAAEYLLKPVEEQEMLAVMTRVVARCQEERLLRLEEAHKLDLLEAGHVAFLRHALSDLLSGRAEGLGAAPELELHLTRYGELEPAAYALVVMHAPARTANDPFERQAEEVLGRPVLLVPLPEGGNADFTLLYALEAGEEKRQQELAHLLLSGLAGTEGTDPQALENSADGDWIMVCGYSAQALMQLPAACAQAARSLRHAVWNSLSGILAAGEEEAARMEFARDPEGLSRGFKELEKRIRSALGSGQLQEAGAVTGEVFDLFAAYPGAGRAYVGGLLSGLIDHLQVLAAPGHPVGQPDKAPGSLEELLACESREQMKQQMLSKLQDIASRLQEKRENKEEYVIHRVIRLVEERYGNPELSLAYLAAEVFVSPNHLGMLFKKNTGRTPIEYIQDYRLARAEELLRTTKQRVSLIAEKVGIPNTSYFGTLFKQAYGMTPGEYQIVSQR